MDTANEQTALQAALILGNTSPTPAYQPVPTPAEPARSKAEARPTPRPKVRKDTVADKALESMAYVASLGIAVGLWVTGAYFTIEFLRSMGLNIAALGLVQWLIPAFITACELKLWPESGRGWQRWMVFLAVLAFDVGTSFAGFIEWGAGRTIPLFEGITLPEQGWTLRVVGVALGLAFAFVPEQLTRWAIPELHQVWKKR